MNLSDYYDMLEKHDWCYVMGSGEVYSRGRKSQVAICRVAEESPEHRELFSAFSKHHAIRGERGPKPLKPSA